MWRCGGLLSSFHIVMKRKLVRPIEIVLSSEALWNCWTFIFAEHHRDVYPINVMIEDVEKKRTDLLFSLAVSWLPVVNREVRRTAVALNSMIKCDPYFYDALWKTICHRAGRSTFLLFMMTFWNFYETNLRRSAFVAIGAQDRFLNWLEPATSPPWESRRLLFCFLIQ